MTERPSDLLILALRAGDTLIVHLPTKPDESYAEDVKAAIRRQLSFDVPIIVVGPGVTFEVARPVSEPASSESHPSVLFWAKHEGHHVGQRHEDGSLLSATCHDCGETYRRDA